MKPGNKVKRIEGVLAPVITPFRKDYAPDAGEPETGPVPAGAGRRLLPSSATLDRLAYRFIAFGFPIWTFGVICGAIWARLLT